MSEARSKRVRSRPVWMPWLLFGLGGVAVAGSWWSNRPDAFDSGGPVARGGVRVSEVTLDHLAKLPRLGASRGDWLMTGPRVAIVVGARGAGAVRKMNFGALLDAAVSSPAEEAPVDALVVDALEELRPVLFSEGGEIPLETQSVAVDAEGRTPVLVVTQQAQWSSVELVTRIRLDPKRSWVHLDTVAYNRSRGAIGPVRLGDRVRWPGAPPFAPGLGLVTDAVTARVPYIARTTGAVSYALVFPGGPTDVVFRRDRVGPTEQIALSDQVTLGAGESARLNRVLVIERGPLGSVSSPALRVVGEPFGTVFGTVKPVPRTAEIEVRDDSGAPAALTSIEPDGSFELAVPPGSYEVVLHAPGGRHVLPVLVGEDARVGVELLAPPPGALRVSVTDAEGIPMPARVTIYGKHPTKKPHFGNTQRAEGMENVAYVKDGEARLELPAGQYRVRVTRGYEYSVFSGDVTIERERGESLQVSLDRVVDTSGWISADFHLHAAPSFDSTVTLADRVLSLAAEGVELAVPTDHNRVTDYAPVVDAARLHDELRSAVGVEVTTVGWGHFNAFPYPIDAPPPQFAGVVPWEIFQDARAKAPRAVIQVNHPRMKGIGYFDRLRYSESQPPTAEEGFSFDFDTIEIVNGFELDDSDRLRTNLLDWFALLDFGYRYTAVGNSDSHSLAFQWAGYPRTYVRVTEDRPELVTPDEVASALLNGRAQISNGIFSEVRVAGTATPGDLVSITESRVPVEVTARAPAWVDVARLEIWQNGRLVKKVPAPERFRGRGAVEFREEIEVERDGWVVAIVRGDRPLSETYPEAKGTPFSVANPVFLDVDGDGRFKARLAPAPTGEGGAGGAEGRLGRGGHGHLH